MRGENRIVRVPYLHSRGVILLDGVLWDLDLGGWERVKICILVWRFLLSVFHIAGYGNGK
jgi:hypothetical protein